MSEKYFQRSNRNPLKRIWNSRGKKGLCLLLTWLLLFTAAGCSQATPQTPDASVPGASGSGTAMDADDAYHSHTEVDGIAAGSAADFNGSGSHADENSGFSVSESISSGIHESGSPGINESDPSGIHESGSPGTSESDPSGIHESGSPGLPEDGSYTSREDVALYLHLYGHLPPNFMTKKEAEALGWKGGSLEPYAPGMCIGGNRFGNYEGLLPEREGRTYTECDIDTLGADKRGAKRIVFSNDGLIYYTEDHYESFELLYGETDL